MKTFPGHTAHMQAVIIRGKAIEASSTGIEEVGQSFAVTRERIRQIEAKALRKLRYQPRTLDPRIKSGALAPAVACYISDLIPTTAHIDITWGMGFDLYPLQTIESKKQYYAKAIPEKWLTIFTHDAKTPWAYVEKDESGKMAVKAP